MLWSEVGNGVKIKYLTSVMSGHANAQDVVTEIFKAFREISHSSETDTFSWNGWAKCEQVYNEKNKPDKKTKAIKSQSSAP